MKAFWDVAPCSLVEVDRRFKGAHCLHHQGDDGTSLKRRSTSRLHGAIIWKALIFIFTAVRT
jgi:hypothetical protein